MYQNIKNKKTVKAFSTVEIILSLSLFFVLVLGLSGAIFYGLNIKKELGEQTKAVFLLDEGVEALNSIKDSDFSLLTPGLWGLIENSSQWALVPTSDQKDGFIRQISIASINENEFDIVVNVSWESSNGSQKSISSSLRLTNWERLVETEVINNWNNPLLINSMDLTLATRGYRVKYMDGHAYTYKSTGTRDLEILDVSSLPSISSDSVLKIDPLGVPYDLWAEAGLIYTTSSSNTKELIVIDVSNPSNPVFRGSIDLPGNSDATGVMKQGDYVYVTKLNNSGSPEFFIVNVSNPDTLILTGQLNLGSNNYFDVHVSGNYAYLASSADNAELTIINISNPAAPTFVSGLGITSKTDATRICYYNGTVFLVQGINVRIINVSNPLAPALISTYSAGAAVGDLVSASPTHSYLFLATSNTLNEFQVVDVSNLASPVLYGMYNTTAALEGVDYDPVNEIAVVVGNVSTGEFLVFSGHIIN